MANEQAVYFIHDCQELRDQVQRMIVEDGLYNRIEPPEGPRMANLLRSTEWSAKGSARPNVPVVDQLDLLPFRFYSLLHGAKLG